MNNIMDPILLGNCVCAGKCFCLATFLTIVVLKHIYSTLHNRVKLDVIEPMKNEVASVV